MQTKTQNKIGATLRPLNSLPAAAYASEVGGHNYSEIEKELSHVMKFLLTQHTSFSFSSFLQYAQSSNASILEKRSYFDGITRRLILEHKIIQTETCMDEKQFEIL